VAFSDVAPECEGASVFSCEASGEPSMQLVLSSFLTPKLLYLSTIHQGKEYPFTENHGMYCIKVIFIYPYLFFSSKLFFFDICSNLQVGK
jgi:hypothetical protein